MSQLNLPLHASMRHPLTGEPIRALYVDKHGRPRYPIMGGAPDDGDDDKAAADKAAADAKAAADKAAADKAAADAAASADKGDDLGFPKDTPVAEMKPAEQAAYHRHHARKHEDRNKEWQRISGGKTAAEVEAELAELDKLRKAQMSAGEVAVDEAKTQGRREASLAIAPQMFDVALQHVEDKDHRKVLIETLDMSKVIKEDGTIDTDKVNTIAAALAPKPAKGDPDYGNGKRTRDTSSSGVGAGRDRYRERHGKADKDS